tara:strand:+ start:2017 stop:2550 length:534 start_codon:yes stop_codon:yes gene_type:complete
MSDLFLQDRILPKSPKIMNVKKIGVKHAMHYNELWHSRLPVTSHSNMIRNKHFVFYGAEYLDHCFAVAMWTDPVAANRMSKDYVWLELRRLAIADDAPRFTATWMIAKMIKQIRKQFPDVTRLVSYQDAEVHSGTIYAAANWQKDTISKFQEWTTGNRERNAIQSKSDKIRWIYDLC